MLNLFLRYLEAWSHAQLLQISNKPLLANRHQHGLVAQIASDKEPWRESSAVAGAYEHIYYSDLLHEVWPDHNRALKLPGL